MPHAAAVPTLRSELRRPRPFASATEEAQVSIRRTAGLLTRSTAELLRDHGLTPTQYNALRVLRSAGEDGLPCSELGARMLTHEPDVTRLIDRLDRAGLVRRERDQPDRRVVTIRISEAGFTLLARLDEPVARLDDRRLAGVSQEELRTLIDILARVRHSIVVSERPSGLD